MVKFAPFDMPVADDAESITWTHKVDSTQRNPDLVEQALAKLDAEAPPDRPVVTFQLNYGKYCVETTLPRLLYALSRVYLGMHSSGGRASSGDLKWPEPCSPVWTRKWNVSLTPVPSACETPSDPCAPCASEQQSADTPRTPCAQPLAS